MLLFKSKIVTLRRSFTFLQSSSNNWPRTVKSFWRSVQLELICRIALGEPGFPGFRDIRGNAVIRGAVPGSFCLVDWMQLGDEVEAPEALITW